MESDRPSNFWSDDVACNIRASESRQAQGPRVLRAAVALDAAKEGDQLGRPAESGDVQSSEHQCSGERWPEANLRGALSTNQTKFSKPSDFRWPPKVTLAILDRAVIDYPEDFDLEHTIRASIIFEIECWP